MWLADCWLCQLLTKLQDRHDAHRHRRPASAVPGSRADGSSRPRCRCWCRGGISIKLLSKLADLRRALEVVRHPFKGPPEVLRPILPLYSLQDEPVSFTLDLDLVGSGGEAEVPRQPYCLAVAAPEDGRRHGEHLPPKYIRVYTIAPNPSGRGPPPPLRGRGRHLPAFCGSDRTRSRSESIRSHSERIRSRSEPIQSHSRCVRRGSEWTRRRSESIQSRSESTRSLSKWTWSRSE